MQEVIKRCSLQSLRKMIASRGVTYYRQGNQWIRSAYSPEWGMSYLEPQGYHSDDWSERQILEDELRQGAEATSDF